MLIISPNYLWVLEILHVLDPPPNFGARAHPMLPKSTLSRGAWALMAQSSSSSSLLAFAGETFESEFSSLPFFRGYRVAKCPSSPHLKHLTLVVFHFPLLLPLLFHCCESFILLFLLLDSDSFAATFRLGWLPDLFLSKSCPHLLPTGERSPAQDALDKGLSVFSDCIQGSPDHELRI